MVEYFTQSKAIKAPCTQSTKVEPVARFSVSVVIPNHNYGHFLAEAIDSALQQSHHPLQVIVVDDASTDHSLAVIQAYGDRIESVLLSTNKGQINAYNVGFERVRGDIVVFLDADDRLKPQALANVLEAFEPGVSKVHWKADLINAQGIPLGQHVPNLLVGGDMKAQLLDHGMLYPSPPGSANAYATAALRQMMPLPQHPTERHGADFFTIYGCALVGKVAVAGGGRSLSDYRLHHVAPAQLSFGNAAQSYAEHERLRLRAGMFRQWVAQWSPSRLEFRHELNEFSIEKVAYVLAIFGASNYWQGLRAGMDRMPELLRCIVHRPAGLISRVALIGYCLSMLMLPRKLGMPMARYLCNPTARAH